MDTLRAVHGQLEVWWFASVTVRMQGLTDDEFFWKPVPDAWCLDREGDQLFGNWPPAVAVRPFDVEITQLGAEDPFVGLVLHMNREVMHHGAEICLLRELYRASKFD